LCVADEDHFMANPTTEGSGETKLETAISYTLIIGVVVSLIFIMAGMILLYHQYHIMSTSEEPAMFIRGNNFLAFLVQLFGKKSTWFTGAGLITVGSVVLILTPYLRTLMSVVYFAGRRNVKYFVITLFVLSILTLSFILH